MTLKELYSAIDGDYDAAMRVLRVEKLLDKHIKKLPANTVFASLFEAGKTTDPVGLFESAHAIKGVCSNLGLLKLAALSEEVCNEFRPGCERKLTDAEVAERISEIEALYIKSCDGIKAYEQQ